MTALIAAATMGDNSLTQKLIKSGAYVTNINGWTPLHIAAIKGNKAAVEGLLAAGIDANVKDKMDATAKDWAISEGHSKIASILP